VFGPARLGRDPMNGDEPRYRVPCGDGRDRCRWLFATKAEAEQVARRLDDEGRPDDAGPHTVERAR